MPEPDAEKKPGAAAEGSTPAPEEAPGQPSDDGAEPRPHWLFFGLGLSLQTVLWFLLFLAITVAVLVGNKLTEFRYVGF